MLAANTERTSPGHHHGTTRWSCWVQQPAPSPTVDRPARRVTRLSRSCRESGPHGRFVRHRRPVHPGAPSTVGRRGKRVDRSTADLAAVGRCCVGIAAETRDDPTHGCGSLRSCTGRGSSPAAARSPWVNAPAGASVRSTPQLHLDTAHLDEAGFLALGGPQAACRWPQPEAVGRERSAHRPQCVCMRGTDSATG